MVPRRLYGWTAPAEAIGQVSHRLLQTDFPRSQADMQNSLRATGEWSGELVHTRRDGQRVLVASRMAVRKDHLGRPLATLELNTDISRDKGLESDLRDSGVAPLRRTDLVERSGGFAETIIVLLVHLWAGVVEC